MRKIQTEWQWDEGEVDEQDEHIELRYGNAAETSYTDWMLIARLSKPKNHVFNVEWLVKQDSSRFDVMVADTRHSLDFYLIQKDEPDPWAYALYHCHTGANMYSSVHWSYFPTGSEGKQNTSRIIQLSAEESTQLFGDSGKPGEYIGKDESN